MNRDIIHKNRAHLHSVKNWIALENYRRSRAHYGCLPRMLPLLNVASPLPSGVRYLELGVSVGKNIYVLANAFAAGFVIVWDDLDRLESGPVTRAFLGIADFLRARYRLPAASVFRVELNGWLGQHEHKHTVGVINNLGLTASAFS